MGEAIPRQHPAVVLRSHFNHLRALLAVALIAVAGLTVAVVILATDDDAGTSAGSAAVSVTPKTEMKDEAGTAAAIARPNVTPQTEMKDEAGTAAAIARPNVTPQAQMKDEAGTAAAIGQSSGGTELLGSKASQDGTSQGR